jgi:phthalate 4,5-cis-dihydrodiol dehydrogenase
MALTLTDCDWMIAAAERAGVHMVVGHAASFNPSIQTMRRMVASGETGRLGLMSATAYTDFLYRPRRPEELVTELGGGIIFNQVPHQVDAVRFLAGGMARSVRACAWVLDPKRPTEGCYAALIEFESGAAASLVYSGYDHFDSGDFFTSSAVEDPERYGKIRRDLAQVQTQEDETAWRVRTGYGGADSVPSKRAARGGMSLMQGELGSFLVTCERADLRMLPDGVGVYSTEGFRLVRPPKWRGIAGLGAVIDELYSAIFKQRPLVHHGRWGKASLEVCLAILESARSGQQVALQHQVVVVDE